MTFNQRSVLNVGIFIGHQKKKISVCKLFKNQKRGPYCYLIGNFIVGNNLSYSDMDSVLFFPDKQESYTFVLS